MSEGQQEPSHSGDTCPQDDCEGRLLVYCTRVVRGVRVRYLRCSKCQKSPANSKQIIPLEFGPARK